MDRNFFCAMYNQIIRRSLSARRAWIEIRVLDGSKSSIEVALRKESVDRNSTYVARLPRAQVVALRKESVDRNFCVVSLNYKEVRRSPQGERG